MSSLCDTHHHYPVDVVGSIRTDGDGGLVKVQQCDFCGAQRRGTKQRRCHPTPSSGSAWSFWVFGDWGPAMPGPHEELSAGTEHTSRAAWLKDKEFLQGDQWPEGTAHARRSAGLPVLLPSASDLLENREAALAHIKMLIAIHGFGPAELVPNSDDPETS